MEALDRVFITYGPYLWLALMVVMIVLLAWLAMMQARFNSFVSKYRRMLPNGRGNLEDVLDRQMDELEQSQRKMEDVLAAVARAESNYRHAIQHVGILRFNPLGDTGGDQSFSLALLDGDDSGIVLTSIFGRAQCRLYAKPVERGISRYQLSAEEEEALKLARNGKVKTLIR